MEEKQGIKISLSTFFLILAIIAIIIMGFFIYKLNTDKSIEIQKSAELQSQVNTLNGTINDLQGKIDTISNTISDEKNINNVKTENIENSSINKRLYKLYSSQRYLLLIDDNTYDMNQDFLNKKTYILDLNMVTNNDIVKEVNISEKLSPFVNSYINKKKGSLNGTFSVEYFGIDDMLTPPEIDEKNEVAFKVYYRCINGNAETSLGSELYAYNIETNTIRDLGSIN